MNKRYIRRDLEYCVEVECMGGEAFEYEMLAANAIPGFLPIQLERVNGQEHLIYTYTGYGLFEDIFSDLGIKGEELYQMVDSVLSAIDSASGYLLSPDNLVLNSDCLFLDKKSRRIYFLYVPGYNKDIREQLREFMDFLSKKIDKKDTQGVMLAWQIHLILKEPTMHFNEIRECLREYKGTEPDENQSARPKEKKEKKRMKGSVWMYLLILFGIFGLLLAGLELYILFHIYYYGIAEWKRNLLICNSILLAVSIGAAAFFFQKERARRQIEVLFCLK